MLKKINGVQDTSDTMVLLKDATFNTPFASRLEYNPPAKGVWNIVHTGMLIPNSHQIFVCARACLRGVVLTAGEMNAMDRMSSILIDENTLINGGMEKLIIDGTIDIMNKLQYTPSVVLLFTSCVHLFMGCNIDYILDVLNDTFKQTTFVDCYMNPTMRKSGLTPEQLMRRQLYKPLPYVTKSPYSVNLLGNDFSTLPNSELITLLTDSHYTVKDITTCKTYQEYLDMAKSTLNIVYYPPALAGAKALARRIEQPYIYIPLTYDFEELEQNYSKLSKALQISKPDYSSLQALAESSLDKAYSIIGDTNVSIDYTATPRPLGLTKLLLQHGFNVTELYLDTISKEEETVFHWLKLNYPNIRLYSTVHVKMRFLERNRTQKVLAIGQKSAYFTGTEYFVNMVLGSGLYGYMGICELANLMVDAYINPKSTKDIIVKKGLGCESCI